MKKLLPFLSLFTSLSTVFCCALPIILVSLGMGAAFASLSAQFPAITWLAQRAEMVFLLTIILLAISGYFIFIKPQACPANADLAKACMAAKKCNKWVWIISVVIVFISLFFKYILILLVR